MPRKYALQSNTHKSNACEVIRCPVDHSESKKKTKETHTMRGKGKKMWKKHTHTKWKWEISLISINAVTSMA